MTFATIKTNIDRKVERMLGVEGQSVDFVINSIEATKANFEQLLTVENYSEGRTHMMKMYLDYSDTKLKDMETLNNYIKSQVQN